MKLQLGKLLIFSVVSLLCQEAHAQQIGASCFTSIVSNDGNGNVSALANCYGPFDGALCEHIFSNYAGGSCSGRSGSFDDTSLPKDIRKPYKKGRGKKSSVNKCSIECSGYDANDVLKARGDAISQLKSMASQFPIVPENPAADAAGMIGVGAAAVSGAISEFVPPAAAE